MIGREVMAGRFGRFGVATVSARVLWSPADAWVGVHVERFRRLGGEGVFSGCLRFGLVPAVSLQVAFNLWPTAAWRSA